MPKIRLPILVSLLAVASLAVLGLRANPATQAEQASTLVDRVDALETKVLELSSQASHVVALSTRVARLESNTGIDVNGTEIPTPTINTDDWEEVTSETGKFTYKRNKEWIVRSDDDDSLFIYLPDTNQYLYLFVDYPLDYFKEIQGDDDAIRELAESFWKDVKGTKMLSSESKQFNGASAIFWDSISPDKDGGYRRYYFVYYPCEENSACVLILEQGGRTRSMTPEDWSLLEAFAGGLSFLPGPITRRSTWLHNCPSSDCDSTVMLPKGESIEVIAQSADGNWYQLKSGEWVQASAVEDAPTELPVADGNATPSPEKIATQSPTTTP